MAVIEQGQIWWLERPDDKRRPCLVLTRDRVIPVVRDVMVAPITTRIRALDTEIELGTPEGVLRPCVISMQHVLTVPKSMLTRRLGRLTDGRWHEVCAALRAAVGC